MERQAFARAWKFLNYRPVAKWVALASSVAASVLYVAFLLVLGLFADLIVHRGHVPAYRDLSPANRDRFVRDWERLTADERKARLKDLGLADRPAAELAGATPEQLSPPEQGLLWRAHLYPLLRDRVSPLAGAYVLPDYRDLPDAAREAFRQGWAAAPEAERADWLAAVGEEKAKELAAAELDKLPAHEWDVLWHARLRGLLKERAGGEAVAEAFWRDRLSGYGGADWLRDLPDRELDDRGILGLVVHSEGRFFGPVLGRCARALPWAWRWGTADHPNYYYYLTGLFALGIGLTLLRAVALFVLNTAAARAAIEAANRMRRAVYHHTYRLGRLAFRALGPSEAVGVFTRQVETVHHGLYVWLTVTFHEPVKFALLLAFALVVHFWLSLAFLFCALLVWLVGGQVAVYFRRQERAATHRAADQIALLQESLMMMRLVKCYTMELFNQARVERQLARYAANQARRYRGEAIYRPLLITVGTLAAVVLFYVAGLVVLHGGLPVAGAVALAAAVVSLYLPLVNWLEQRRLLRRAREAAVILFKFLDRPGEVGQAVGAEFLPPLGQALEFDNVSLTEPGTGRRLLQNVSFSIRAGERVGLVGPEEMQKHALVYLIPRFLDPGTGEIRIDGHNIRWVTFDSLRAQIGLVMQHNLVFNDTVANNIGCGDPGYDLPKIIEAAKIAHAHHFIQKLPRGYETAIGEMGHTLSASEQFRIALARALLRDPAIYIIEETGAAVDEDTKSLLDDTFTRVLPGRTVLFLPHRISTIRSCDRMFFLNKGKVEAVGEHRELLAQNDLYKHLHYMEFNEFAEQY